MKLALYLITGLVMTAQTYWLLMWAIWGAPTSFIEYVALLGGLCLLLAAILSIWLKRLSAWLAFASILMMWCFYLPAFFVCIFRSPNAAWDVMSVARLGVVLFLLLASSTFAMRDVTNFFRARRDSKSPAHEASGA
jgi:hypothetical protein